MPAPSFLTPMSYEDPNFNLSLISLIQPLRIAHDYAEVLRRVYALGGTQAQSFPIEISPTVSATLLMKWGSTNLIVSGGTEGTTHLAGLLDGWINPSVDEDDYGANRQLAQAARDIQLAAPSQWFDGLQTYYLAGHSYGGAQLTALAASLRNRLAGNNIKIITYGSPRPGNSRLQTYLETCQSYRWFTEEDSVPRVPPWTPESAILSLVLPNRVQQTVNQQVQPTGGLMLQVGGSVLEQETSVIPLSTSEPGLLSWMTGSQCFGAQSHALDEYKRRFELQLQHGSTVSRSRTTFAPTLRPRVQADTAESGPQLTAEERARLIAASVRQLEGLPMPIQGPSYNPEVRNSKYTVRHYPQGWVVIYDGEIVAIGPGKRQAKKIAKTGNRALRSVPREV